MTLAAIDSFSPLCTEPDDFDKFWEATVANVLEVEAMPVMARQKPPAPGLVFDHVKFRSLGNETVAAYLMTQDTPEPKPLIVHSHGYNSQYDVMLNWANAGYHVFGLDFRGFGRSAGMHLAGGGYILTGLESPQTSILRGAIMDLVQGVRTAKSLLGWRASSVVLYGFSFGGAMAIMSAALDPIVDFLVVGQPTLGWHSERLRLSKAGSSAELSRFFDQHPERRPESMQTLQFFDTIHFASRVRTPTLLGIGLDDEVVPSRSVIAIANSLSPDLTEIRFLPVAHSADPRESLWADFDDEWLHLGRDGLPPDYGSEQRKISTVERAIA